MADIFISYSRSDRDRCTRIREQLDALKVSVWFDAGIGAGSNFDREIEREIETATALLVLWSEQSVESDWVRNEARTGKERSGLIAVQLEECQMPLEFRSVQAEVLPEGAEGTEHKAWIGVLSRIGELLDRPGLAEYAKLSVGGGLEEWKAWLARYPADPLAGEVIDNIVEKALPDMRQQLATERARRSTLEAELAEHTDASKASSGELATNARELVRLRQDLDKAQSAKREAETELSRFQAAAGTSSDDDDGGLSGLGIVLGERLALYVGALLWVVAIWFIWSPLNELMNDRGGLSSVFWVAFGVVALGFPAVLVTIRILRKRSAMTDEQELAAD